MDSDLLHYNEKGSESLTNKLSVSLIAAAQNWSSFTYEQNPIRTKELLICLSFSSDQVLSMKYICIVP